MKVSELMTTSVQACLPETSLATAAMMMWENDCGVLPVVDLEEKLVGVITDRDICMGTMSKEREPSMISVNEVISGNAYSCGSTDDVRQAFTTMREKRVRRLPVTDADGKLEGVLSINDAVLHAKENGAKKQAVSYHEVMETFKAICAHPEPAEKHTAAAA